VPQTILAVQQTDILMTSDINIQQVTPMF